MKRNGKDGTRKYKVGGFKVHERTNYSSIYELLKTIQNGGGPNLADQIKEEDIIVEFIALYES